MITRTSVRIRADRLRDQQIRHLGLDAAEAVGHAEISGARYRQRFSASRAAVPGDDCDA
jgi:hypothetical protein